MALVMSWSTNTTITLNPLDIGSSIMKSSDTMEKGMAPSSGGIRWSGAFGWLGRFLMLWQMAHPSMKLNMNFLMLGHQYNHWTKLSILTHPGWPAGRVS